MKEILREKYLPQSYQGDMLDKWNNLRQGSKPATEYVAQFEEYLMRCDIREDERMTLSRFRQGLNDDLRKELVLREVDTLDQAYTFVQNYEMVSKPSFGRRFESRNTPWPPATLPLSRPVPNTAPLLKNGFGHKAANCGNRTLFVNSQGQNYEGDDIEEQLYEPDLENLPDSDEDCEGGDVTLGVVRCALTQAKEDNDWRCNAIFYTYIKCGEKDCKVIIDSGSCINAVSSSMSPALGLNQFPILVRTMSLGPKEFEREINDQSILFAVVVHDASTESQDTPPEEVTSILQEFHEHYVISTPKKKLNSRHGRWLEFLQDHTFVLKHRSGVENKAADALSRRAFLLSLLDARVVGFERLKEDYESCLDFRDSYLALSSNPSISLDDYIIREGFLFRATKLCIPRTSMRDFLVWEIHAGGLAGHFGRDKTIEEDERQFYWPTLKRDVAKIVPQCRTCQVAKHRKQNTGLYTPLPVPDCPWQDVSMDFVLGLHPDSRRRRAEFQVGDYVMVRIRPERYPSGTARKLCARSAGPFKVLKRIGPNAYVIDLPPESGISSTFNIEDLIAFKDEQIISTRDGDVQRFLVCWSGRPASDDTWITSEDLQQIDRDLFEYYQSRPAIHSTESSFLHPGRVGGDTGSRPPITRVYRPQI
ncbi:hypothetical protein Acr_07g0013520 [Actinidia rufa]|uniref:Chromo domain-containing protein n=1 Tax=Actinidia rufa TaxID=165716 RepID=A0A7J0EY92_9ERIC|nr:hypothetical protein Acr_07g0013520 [Actinidia rufa]